MSDQFVYIPHSALDGLPVKVSFIKIWDENSILAPYMNDSGERDSYLITCQLVINGQSTMHPKPLKTLKRNQLHEDVVIFPVSYKDLSYNAMIAITIFSSGKQYDAQFPLGCTTLPLFDENLRLREGKHNLVIWPNLLPDISFETKTPGLVHDKNISNLNFCTQKIETYETQTQSQEVTENLALSNLRLKLLYCYKTIPAAFIEISLPHFPKPVMFEDVEYQFDEHGLMSLGGGYNMSSQNAEQLFNNPLSPAKQQPPSRIFIPTNAFSHCFIINDYNSELERSNPIEDMSWRVFREDIDPENLKPSKDEAEQMIRLIRSPLIEEMKSEQKVLFFRYRYYLLRTQPQFSAALPRFLHSVDWGNRKEEEEVLKILGAWGPLEIEDALYLLSFYTSCNDLFINRKNKKPLHCMIEVRKFAVICLKRQTDEVIETVLLQLVQALKYESTDDSSELVQFLFSRASKNKSLATLLYWYLNVEQDVGQGGGRTLVTDWYKKLFEEFRMCIERDNYQLWTIISRQIQFREKLQRLSQHIRSMRNDRTARVQEIRNKLGQADFQDPDELPQHPCCLNPSLVLQKAVPKSTTIFSSAMAPIRLCFESLTADNAKLNYMIIFKNGDDLRQDQLVMQVFSLMDTLLKGVNQDMKLLPYKILACSKSDGFLEFVPETITVQDILAEGSVSLYLKKLSNDPNNPFYLDLLPNDKKDFNNPQTKQLIQELIESNKDKGGIHPQIMKNYVMSCAGYCVLTYLLGIGDRHLENILLNNEGKMFHIDFGFILGKDPKPIPPPFKLCKEMIEGMGGEKTENYTLFKKQCVDVYIYLRQYAKLIITLFQLMQDAGIKDYSHLALETMEEKFRLEDSNYNAEIHFLGIIEESVKSLFPVVTDTIHKWASYWRR